MPPSSPMLAHLQGNVTTLAPIWKITATDTTVAAYAAHTRSLTFESVVYSPAPVEPSRLVQRIGLEANSVELFGVFDSIITEPDVQGGRWKNASIQYEFVNYLDLTMGSVGRIKGKAGEFTIENGTYRLEVRSLAELMRQEIGELTAPVDRNRRPEDLGVSMTSFTHARTVTAVVDRMNFTVNGTAQANDYFAYGRAEFTSGANSGLKMEIKASVGNAIELQLPMRSTIAIGNNVTLIAGYDGTRDQARDKFGAADAFNGEPDLPGLKGIIVYPE
jgi:uncharacterized phage protein (TIGR02218 family)